MSPPNDALLCTHADMSFGSKTCGTWHCPYWSAVSCCFTGVVLHFTTPAAAAALGQGGSAAEPPPQQRVVHARFVVAADGPSSPIRQQLYILSNDGGGSHDGGGPAEFSGVVRWSGRLAGDQLCTIPGGNVAAWWTAHGQVFSCHPLAGGDVAWEAVLQGDALQRLGWAFDPASRQVVPLLHTTSAR